MIRFALAIVLALSIAPAMAREIAITFDDAPRGDTALSTGENRTPRLIAALKAAGIEQAAFFCVPQSSSPRRTHAPRRLCCGGPHHREPLEHASQHPESLS